MIRLLKPAQLELDEAFDFYESQNPGLGFYFIEEFEKASKRIELFPEAWHPFSYNTRRCLLNRFPYAIVYTVDDHEIVFVAIYHLHRKPLYWKNRIK
jgi:toxin ParE2